MKIAFGANAVNQNDYQQIISFIEKECQQKLEFNQFSEKNNFEITDKIINNLQTKKVDLAILVTDTGTPYFMYGCKNQDIIAANCDEEVTSIMTRRHNNTNFLVIGLDLVTITLAKVLIKNFLETPYDGGRHQGRVNMLHVELEGEQ